ncbi:MAG: DUF4097 domain-containing protein [Christensenellaceae bacterium]|jgi:hypothetical protein|nr:DUF4097 domain-containing protein [Christensenellaceae bacterium]
MIKKKTFLWACLITALVGLCFAGLGLALGIQNIGRTTKGWVRVPTSDYMAAQQELPAFDSLYLDMDLSRVELIPSDHYALDYNLPLQPNGQAVDIRQDGGALRISHQNDSFKYLDTINFGWLPRSNHRSDYIQITYDASKPLKLVDVKVSVGDVHLNGVDAEALSVYAALGKVEYSGTAANASFKLDCGDFVGTVQADTAKLQVSLGAAKLTGSHIGQFTATMDCGDFSFKQGSLLGGSITQSLGNIRLEDADIANMTLESDCGDISIAGAVTGNTTIRLDLGDINLTTRLPLSSYSYKVDMDLGNLQIDGQRASASGGQGPNRLDIDSSTGDVRLYFN